MKNKTLITSRKKKSIASLFLALLLMFSFNSTPMVLLANNMRKTNAYKPTETQTYYSNNASELEKNFSDGKYPSSLEKYFDGSTKNFNVYNYYTAKFEENYKTIIEPFFNSWDGAYGGYSGETTEGYAYKRTTLFSHFGVANLYELYTSLQNGDYLKELATEKNYSVSSYQDFVELLALYGLPEYSSDASMPAILSSFETDATLDTCTKLSTFYRLVRSYTYSEGHGYDSFADDEGENDKISSRDAFYKSNTHYVAISEKIVEEIKKNAPAYIFDNETQDTNIAAIFANNAPLSLNYNYTGSYTTYTTPNITYVTETDSNVKYRAVYYWGNQADVSSNAYYQAHSAVWKISSEADKAAAEKDMIYYRPILEGEDGYVEGKTTYYKVNGLNYVTTYNKIYTIYVLNNNPTQNELDTYSAMYFTPISQSDLDADMEKTYNSSSGSYSYNNPDDRYYINIPYEEDQLYFKCIYNNYLFSKSFDFDSFVDYFTYKDGGKTLSKLYIKCKPTSERNVVFIEETKLEEFKEAYPDYTNEVRTFRQADFIENDYELITQNSSNSGYLPTSSSESLTFELYFQKVKEYYTVGVTSTYSGYEQEKDVIKNLTQTTIASSAYELADSGKRDLYVLDNGVDLSSTSFDDDHKIKQSEIDANPNYYVPALASEYESLNLDSTIYNLYYKHTSTTADEIYVVDDSSNASENPIYKTLNYKVITSTEYKNNYSNYLLVVEGDVNYNENFLLYYKYERTANTSKYYVLRDDIASVDANTVNVKSQYSYVGSGELSDYVLMEENESNETQRKYKTVRKSFFGNEGNGGETLHLYYKKTDVFVQNELKNGNAIYVVDSSLGSGERETYSANYWTVITKTDVSNNPELYVQITEKDENYSEGYTLYYRYIESSDTHNKVYSIEDINTTASDFNANDYHLITSGEYGYIQNSELYYKKIITSSEDIKVPKESFYYYQTSSTVTLSSNSYYAISFYVFTTNNDGDNAKASFIIKDTAGIMSDIKLENISTNGTWQQYYIFISTDTATSSTINLYLYLGDEEHGIKGDNNDPYTSSITGAVFFDNIEITKIGVTDYNKRAISNELVYSTPLTTGEGDSKTNVEGCYADEYNNQIFIANVESIRPDANRRFENNIYDYKNLLNNSAITGDYKGYTWNDMFDFDNATDNDNLKNILGYYSASTEEDVDPTVTPNKLLETLGTKDTTHNRYNITGYDMYNLYTGNGTIDASNDLFPTLWRYYVSRDLGRDGLSLDKYLNAYAKGDLEVSITNKIEETKVDEDDDDEDDDDDEKDADDIVYVSEPFNVNNYALKLENKNNDISLGITSNAFIIQQFGYYKITVWIYSPDKEGTATLTLNSVAYGSSANQQGSLLTTTISSANANVANSTSNSDEYGWIPVTFYVEGNARRDMQCYLVLSADNNSTVYFDNITIEKITSKLYDSNTSSSAYSGALSLTPSATYDNTGIKNGNFDYVTETNASITNSVNTINPRPADNWTELSTNSDRVVAGVVSTKNQNEFFDRYVGGRIPYETYSHSSYQDDFSNIYAIYAPGTVDTILENDSGDPITTSYAHNYSIYSGSLSLSSSTLYEISFKFYADTTFSGNLVSNIYLSSVKTANIFASMKETQSDNGKWKTYTYYISTGTSSQTVYLEIGVENAVGACYFKNVSSTKVSTGETLDEIIARVAKDNNITSGSTTDIYNAIKNVRFIDMADMDFSYHEPNENETGLFEQKVFTNNTETTDDHTSGKTGVVVANYFDTVQTTTYSVTINKTTYYIGEVYKVSYNDNDYFVHKTYNAKSNTYEYKLYSDTELSQEITQIDGQDVVIEATSTGINVSVGSVSVEQSNITTTYRLYKYSDLREEVTEIDGSEVKVENLNKVVVGTGSKATENTTTTETNTSYIYHFGSNELEFNNNIIPSSELVNNQSGNVLILANGYSTDYITLTQTTTRTIGKSTYNVLRIYVKTSNFSSEDFGLNIEIDAINVKWENINTTKLTDEADNYGFVCYEVLISTNSTDSVSNFAVKLSLGSEDDLGYGYAIISDISLETFSSKEAFEHYSDVAGEKETVKRKLYEETSSSSSSDDEEPDDKNSVSWATFFYIFSSILLVVTMVIAMVALVLKKHPIKFAKKYANEHDRDIDSLTTKKTTISTNSSDSLYGADSKEKKNMKDKNNSGGII